MNHATRLKKSPQTFRRLTGIGSDEFTSLLSKLAPLYEVWNAERLSKKPRQRKVGAGGKFHLDLEDRLLMLLIYYRCYITHAFLGFLFQIHDSNVSRNINPLMPLLADTVKLISKALLQSTKLKNTENWLKGSCGETKLFNFLIKTFST